MPRRRRPSHQRLDHGAQQDSRSRRRIEDAEGVAAGRKLRRHKIRDRDRRQIQPDILPMIDADPCCIGCTGQVSPTRWPRRVPRPRGRGRLLRCGLFWRELFKVHAAITFIFAYHCSEWSLAWKERKMNYAARRRDVRRSRVLAGRRLSSTTHLCDPGFLTSHCVHPFRETRFPSRERARASAALDGLL